MLERSCMIWFNNQDILSFETKYMLYFNEIFPDLVILWLTYLIHRFKYSNVTINHYMLITRRDLTRLLLQEIKGFQSYLTNYMLHNP